jgi:hypothetical protein
LIIILEISLVKKIFFILFAEKITKMKKKLFVLSVLQMLAIISFAQIPAYLPHAGLCAWFPFTGNANDSSGHGHNGTVYGATMTSGRYGVANTAYYFNGTSNYIYVPPGTPGGDMSTDITSSLTISAWAKSRNYSMSSQEQIYWRGDATSAHDPHSLCFTASQVRLRRDVDPGTTSNQIGTSIAALDTNFHLFTGTYDSATSVMNIYVDGLLMNTAVLSGLETYPTSTMYNYIGAVDGGTWQFFYGVIDELALWSRALTPCEVAALYYSVPDIITSQPRNDTAIVGSVATFSITDLVTSTTYQWQENSGSGFVNLTNTPPYSGVYTPTLTISPATTSLSGNLYRCVPVSGTCLTDTSVARKLTVIIPSEASVIAGDNNLSVVPNPNNGSFALVGSAVDAEEISIQVTDVMGKVVYSDNIILQGGLINKYVRLNQESARGLYFVKVHSRNESKILPVLIGN